MATASGKLTMLMPAMAPITSGNPNVSAFYTRWTTTADTSSGWYHYLVLSLTLTD